ncbi:tRNA (adenosine(37)-N6)-dimethylallyltransferase MiaA [soil metagenome]
MDGANPAAGRLRPIAPIVAIVGPTATGKSDLALALAERLDGEIVNADASQLYLGMDIGTAKVPPSCRRGIAHHELDVLTVADEASVAAYQRHARADVAAIRRRGARPIVVGGSGLYVRALLDALDIPPTDASVRSRLEAAVADEGVEVLHARLVALDPIAAAAIDPRNGRRLVRALEVIELTGRPFSATLPRREYVEPTIAVGLSADRDVLDQRIERRVRHMWAGGLVEEVRSLAAAGLRQAKTASRAVGYRQTLAHLDGELSAEDAQTETMAATRKLARRQMSWFGADPRVVWLPHDADDLVEQALSAIDASDAPDAPNAPNAPNA